MKKAYSHLFYRYYQIAVFLRGSDPKKSALYYISFVLSFIVIIPVMAFVYDKFDHVPKAVVMTAVVIFSFLVHWLNVRYFNKNIRLQPLIKQYSVERRAVKVLGMIMAVLIFFLTPVALIMILSLF